MKILLKPLIIAYSIYAYLLFTAFMLVGFIYTFFLSILLSSNAHVPSFMYYKLWSRMYFFLTGIRMKISGLENFQSGQSYIITGNHSSNLDLLNAAYFLPLKTKALAKIQIKKIPVLGYLFGIVSVFVDRHDKESRLKSINDLKKWLNKGYSIFIYPEGTRNTTNKPLKDFYDGAFRMAIETQQPILPVCVINGKKIWAPKTYWLKPGTMKAIYLPPVSTLGMHEGDIPQLKEKIYRMMESCILENDKMFK